MLSVDVLRNAARNGYDCTNGGVSARFDRLYVEIPDTPFEPRNGEPVMVLEQHHPGCLRLRPKDERRWCMFGGNFAHTSDSRFNEACERLLGHRRYGAVAIHDRIEG